VKKYAKTPVRQTTSYGLGDVFKELDAVGRSNTTELSLRYPLLRSVTANAYAQLGVETRNLRDEVRSTGTRTDKRARVASLNLWGDRRDSWLGGGITQASLGLTSGQLMLRSPDAAELDGLAARTAGSYHKWSWSLERQQVLMQGVNLSAALRGQQASKNLDSSEKFSLGGPGGVRAYGSGEASGDEGWLASLELRYALTREIGVSVFHDAGRVSVNRKPFLDSANRLSRSCTGLGLQGNHGAFDWRLTLAWRGSDEATAEPDKKLRAWLQAGWRF